MLNHCGNVNVFQPAITKLHSQICRPQQCQREEVETSFKAPRRVETKKRDRAQLFSYVILVPTRISQSNTSPTRAAILPLPCLNSISHSVSPIPLLTPSSSISPRAIPTTPSLHAPSQSHDFSRLATSTTTMPTIRILDPNTALPPSTLPEVLFLPRILRALPGDIRTTTTRHPTSTKILLYTTGFICLAFFGYWFWIYLAFGGSGSWWDLVLLGVYLALLGRWAWGLCCAVRNESVDRGVVLGDV
ncbi:hypothetical protein EJ05DRAFT_73044 [Pseudovirgaria hyperparasitica]|uniref:Uncharacterized protein n=1 Tax=Pseudovirgaria hyperparasitica TaxID=470096 RepID=A0A6A6W2B2_9PEZI|nr:uncharacterized protein EJ05DRAFT_73044 [Pseudovirgaria hyperparasitica]KAF2756695.1 hypothetical protein EJ05DRAFT_73044 [Pseudovirgaria hyperparasitica]